MKANLDSWLTFSPEYVILITYKFNTLKRYGLKRYALTQDLCERQGIVYGG